MKNSQIIEQFNRKRYLYETYGPKIEELIKFIAIQEGLIIHDIRSRVKEIESFEKKLKKKSGKYSSLREVTDVLGIRIITYFNDDVDRMASMIEREFVIDKENSVDKRENDPDRFGYSSLHYIVSLKEERTDLPEYFPFKDVKFEIQIRSILQHAWAEIEHDLGYKSKKEIPEAIRRDFSRIAGLLELADNEFLRIKEFLRDYAQEVEGKIEAKSLEIPVDKVTLKEYLLKSPIIKEINETFLELVNGNEITETLVLEKNISTLEFFNIYTIEELDQLLYSNKDKIINFFKAWMLPVKEPRSSIKDDAALFFLFYTLVYQKYSIDLLQRYLVVSPIGEEYYDETMDMFEELIKSDLKI